MFRFAIILLLINTYYYHSLGNPVPHYVNDSLLSRSLKALANNCENSFLVSQISNQVLECNLNVPPYENKQMQCLIFYDINSQLCDAINNKKIILQQNITSELNKITNVNLMCSTAKDWKITNFTEFPEYKFRAENVFNKSVACEKVCGVTDILSEDSNIYCKYFMWGSDVLKIHASVMQEKSMNSGITPGSTEKVAIIEQKKVVISNYNNAQNLNTISDINIKGKDAEIDFIHTTLKNPKLPIADVVQPNKILQTSTSMQGSAIESSLPNLDKNLMKDDQIPVVQKPSVPAMNEGEKSILDEEEQPPKKEDVEKEDLLLNNQESDLGVGPIDAKPLSDDADEWQGSEEEDEEIQDLKDDQNKINNKPIQEEKSKETDKSYVGPAITSFNIDNSQGDFMTKAGAEGFSDDDDDYFFTFFFILVLSVVFLYILYHSKNKFVKVILGLIVEGRQSGRRRNSRGHAYRRLDTLEQAMSSNTTAPPSKIIY